MTRSADESEKDISRAFEVAENGNILERFGGTIIRGQFESDVDGTRLWTPDQKGYAAVAILAEEQRQRQKGRSDC